MAEDLIDRTIKAALASSSISWILRNAGRDRRPDFLCSTVLPGRA